jgi:predicted nucleotidyltransferase
MQDIDQTIKAVLKRHPHISLAILFGSHAHGRTTASSDLDIAVAASRPLSTAEKMSLIDDLALQFGCPIDVVDLMAVSGPILQQALCKGRILHKKRSGLLAQLMLKMWYNQADFMPYYNRILRERVEAFAHG